MHKHPLLLLALIISINLLAQKPRVKHNTITKGANTFSFVHITDTHIGEGCEAHDYGTKGYDGLIQPGMTLCVESFIGSVRGGEGVKLEELVLVQWRMLLLNC